MSQAEQRRIAELQARIVSLESEVEHWRNRAMQVGANVIPLPTAAGLKATPVTRPAAVSISQLNIPVYDPNRNLILDPIKQAPDDSAT